MPKEHRQRRAALLQAALLLGQQQEEQVLAMGILGDGWALLTGKVPRGRLTKGSGCRRGLGARASCDFLFYLFLVYAEFNVVCGFFVFDVFSLSKAIGG